jgi:methionyl-tRNA synthetase
MEETNTETTTEQTVAQPEPQEQSSHIEYDDFKKVQIQVGEIMHVEPVSGSEKLLKLTVKFGEEERQILSGIAKFVSPEELVGKKVPFVTNLKPRAMMGLESNGMILAATDADGNFSLLNVDTSVASGTHVS